MKKTFLSIIGASGLLLANLQAGSVSLADFSTTVSLGGTPVTGTISAIWGSYSSGVFTPYLGNTQSATNTGYFAAPDNELQVTLTQSDNTLIASNGQMYVSIFNTPGGAGTSTWSSSTPQVVLTQSDWLVPTFTLTTPELTYAFSASTSPVAVNGLGTGTFNYNSGSPQISMIPEPSTYALMALGGLVVFFIARRRKAQQA